MISFNSFRLLLEDFQQDLIAKLNSMGFENITPKTRNRLIVRVDNVAPQQRSSALNPQSSSFIFKGIPGRYVRPGEMKGITSSAGAFVTETGQAIELKIDGELAIKRGSAGKDNEDKIITTINGILSQQRPIEIEFSAPNKRIVVRGIVGVEDASKSANQVNSVNKADFVLITDKGKRVPISLKQDSADFWGSEKRKFAQVIKSKVDELIANKTVTLVGHETHATAMRITPEVAFRLSDEDAQMTVFGTDLLPSGFVVKKTFDESSFAFDEDRMKLVVACSKIYKSLADVDETSEWPYLLVTNNSSKRGILDEPGVDLRSAMARRVGSKVLKVDL